MTAANTPLKLTANGLPPGLAFTATNGLISGTPTLAGNYPVTLTASNAVGLGASLVNIQVIDTGSSVVREVWLGVPGTNVADIPTGTPATVTNTLGTLEGITNFGSNYGERVRGYFTAPVTGNYYFWIAASDAAELWISDDNEPVNQIKRANVWPANGGTAYRSMERADESAVEMAFAGRGTKIPPSNSAQGRHDGARPLVRGLAAGPARHQHCARRRGAGLFAVALLSDAGFDCGRHALHGEHARAAGRQQHGGRFRDAAGERRRHAGDAGLQRGRPRGHAR